MRHPGLRQFAVFPVFSILPSVTRVAPVSAAWLCALTPLCACPVDRCGWGGVGASSLSGGVGGRQQQRFPPNPRPASRAHAPRGKLWPPTVAGSPYIGGASRGRGLPAASLALAFREPPCPPPFGSCRRIACTLSSSSMRARTLPEPGLTEVTL